jgi:hypothetical protein
MVSHTNREVIFCKIIDNMYICTVIGRRKEGAVSLLLLF